MNCLAENLSVLIWKNKSDLSRQTYREYISHVANQCHIEEDRFLEILKGEELAEPLEVKAIRCFFSDCSDDLSAIEYVRLYEDIIEKSKDEIEYKNIMYLLRSLESGETIGFVEQIGVNPSTVTRWKNGTTKPDRVSREKIYEYFGIKDYHMLKYAFLFFGIEPASINQKKKKIIELIENMDRKEFEIIYPSLIKLTK